MVTIGKFLFFAQFLFISALGHAALRASVERNEISIDESVSFKISTDSTKSGTFEPKFEASDFEMMNQFENSQFSSVYVNGQFESKNEHSITFILRPLKAGSLKIKNIRNQSSNEKTNDIIVQVSNDTNAGRKSLTGETPSLKGDAKNFFVKAEINKSKAYKGEQVVVSYYLYRRTRANLRDVMQYPSFQGFIREDLEMPILSGRLDFEAVSLGGIPFERALLARYALYPIKEGKLKIDGLSVRADYIPKNNATDDLLEDPFFQFFSQVTPRTGTSKSDPVNVEVLPIPEEGRSLLYSGGVGDFEVSSQLDSGTYKANSPLNLKITVHGKGNASLIEFPTMVWPKEFKFFESQGKPKNLGQGNTEKTFEVVLVPQEKGQLEIPSLEFEFFNPETRSYYKKKTSSIPIQVLEGDPQSSSQVFSKPSDDEPAPDVLGQNQNWGALKTKNNPNTESNGNFMGQPWWRWVAWGGLLVFFSFLGLIIFDQIKKRSQVQLDALKSKQDQDSFWDKLLSSAASAPLSQSLEQAIDLTHDMIDKKFKISSRSIPRRELAKFLTPDQFKIFDALVEFYDTLRFSGSDASSPQDEDRIRALKLIEGAKVLTKKLIE